MIYWNVDPEIVVLFGIIPLRYYGLLIVLGVLISFRIEKRIYVSENIPIQNLEKLASFLFVGILLGMRLGHCLFYEFEYYTNHILEIFIPFTKVSGNWQFIGFRGLASHGGGIGAIISIILYCRKYQTSVFWALDRIAIATPITGAFIRFGNFMNSEIYGKPTKGNYGVIFMRDDMIPRHPTQLYEAFSYLLIFALLWYFYKKTSMADQRGFLLGVLLSLVFIARFIIEFFKENQVAFEDNMSLNMGQLLSIPFVLVGIALIIISKKNSKLVSL